MPVRTHYHQLNAPRGTKQSTLSRCTGLVRRWVKVHKRPACAEIKAGLTRGVIEGSAGRTIATAAAALRFSLQALLNGGAHSLSLRFLCLISQALSAQPHGASRLGQLEPRRRLAATGKADATGFFASTGRLMLSYQQ